MAAGHRARVRKKVENYDIDVLEDHELIELLLFPHIPRKDVNPLAHKLIDSFGSLKAVLQAEPGELMRFPNMTEKGALYLPLFLKVAARANSSEFMTRVKRSSAGAVLNCIANKIGNEKFEQFCVVAIDRHDRLGNMRRLTLGDDTSVKVNPVDLVQFAIAEKTKEIVIAHNHPVDSPYPSQEDIDLTYELAQTLERLQISLSDHIIVSYNAYFSFRQAGILEKGVMQKVSAEYVKDHCDLKSINE